MFVCQPKSKQKSFHKDDEFAGKVREEKEIKVKRIIKEGKKKENSPKIKKINLLLTPSISIYSNLKLNRLESTTI